MLWYGIFRLSCLGLVIIAGVFYGMLCYAMYWFGKLWFAMLCYTTERYRMISYDMLSYNIKLYQDHDQCSGNLGDILSNFGKCRILHTFETIFRLNVGKILDDWERLGNIDLKILPFGLHFPPKFLSGSDWGTFLMNSVQ